MRSFLKILQWMLFELIFGIITVTIVFGTINLVMGWFPVAGVFLGIFVASMEVAIFYYFWEKLMVWIYGR